MFQPFRITGDRSRDYRELQKTLAVLVHGETKITPALANAAALLNWYWEDINWIGFYLYSEDEKQLILGPFQGLPACVRIAPGQGVCGTSYSEGRTLIVPDVLRFPGHIACDSASRSEMVVPLVWEDCVYGVLDVDSPKLDRFDETDALWIGKAALLLSPLFQKGRI